MKVVVVKDRRQREQAVNKYLKKKGNVVAVVSSPKYLKNELVQKANVVILEQNEEGSRN
ncbi:hypothetical protein [Aquifex sp.]